MGEKEGGGEKGGGGLIWCLLIIKVYVRVKDMEFFGFRRKMESGCRKLKPKRPFGLSYCCMHIHSRPFN